LEMLEGHASLQHLVDELVTLKKHASAEATGRISNGRLVTAEAKEEPVKTAFHHLKQ